MVNAGGFAFADVDDARNGEIRGFVAAALKDLALASVARDVLLK